MHNKINIARRMIALIMVFVVFFNTFVFAVDPVYSVKPRGKWQFGFERAYGSIQDVQMGEAFSSFTDFTDGDGEPGDPLQFDHSIISEGLTSYFPAYRVGVFYQGNLIYEDAVGKTQAASDFWNITTIGDAPIDYDNPDNNTALKSWVMACKSDPNTPLEIKIIPYAYKNSAGNTVSYNDVKDKSWSQGIPVTTSNPSSGTWLSVLTGFDDADKALAELNMLDGTSGDITGADLYESEDKSGGFFQALEEAIADIIFGLANLIFNIVQDGIKTFGSTTGSSIVTIDDIVFDRYSETNINFWDSSNPSTLINQFKSNISEWFYKFRALAIAGYLIMLLYIGVRILLAVGGKQQERYKDMLTCWGQGVIILFIFPLVIRYSMKINHAIVTEIGSGVAVRTVSGSVQVTYPQSTEDTEDAQIAAQGVTTSPFEDGASNGDYMAAMANSYKQEKSIMKAFVYLVMVIQFILILITYYKRLFMFSFLFVIFPIIAFTYVIDKVGDGHAQAFEAWTKEIILNIFMQCIHAVVYVFVMSVAFTGTTYNNDWVLTIVGITFLFKGEEILRTILGQSGGETAKSMKQTAAKAAATIAVTQTISNKLSSGASKATGAVRAERQARADRRIARSMRGEETTARGRARNMLNEFKKGRDDNNWETRRAFAKRVVNARKAQTKPGWAQQYMQGGNGVVIIAPPNLQSEAGKEMLDAARVVSDPIGEGANPEQLAKAYDTIKKYDNQQVLATLPPDAQAEIMDIKSQLGISDDQLRMIADAQASAAKQLLAADTTDDKSYQQTLVKVNKELGIKLSTILTGSKQNFDSRDVVMWKRAVLADLRNVSSDQIRSGLVGPDGDKFLSRGSSQLRKSMSSKEQEEKFISRASDLQAWVDVSDRDKIAQGGMFAIATSRKGLTSLADQEKRRILKSLESDPQKKKEIRVSDEIPTGFLENERNEKVYQRLVSNSSNKEKEELAESIAVLKDFGARTHLTHEQQIANESTNGYTVEDIQDRIAKLKELVNGNSELESIISNELGFKTEELGQIVDNLVMISYPDSPGHSVVAENMPKGSAADNIRESIQRDASRQNLGGAKSQLMMKRRESTVRRVRKRVIERKERDIVYTMRNVGVDGRREEARAAPISISGPNRAGMEVVSESYNREAPETSRVRVEANAGAVATGAIAGASIAERATTATRQEEIRDRIKNGSISAQDRERVKEKVRGMSDEELGTIFGADGTLASGKTTRKQSAADARMGRGSVGEPGRMTPEDILERARESVKASDDRPGVASSTATLSRDKVERTIETLSDREIAEAMDRFGIEPEKEKPVDKLKKVLTPESLSKSNEELVEATTQVLMSEDVGLPKEEAKIAAERLVTEVKNPERSSTESIEDILTSTEWLPSMEPEAHPKPRRETAAQRFVKEQNGGEVDISSLIGERETPMQRIAREQGIGGPVEATSVTNEGADSRINLALGGDSAQSSGETSKVNHRYYRTSAGGDMAIDQMFELLEEHKDLRFDELSQDGPNRSKDYAHVIGQLHAGDNREKVAGLVDDLLQGTQKVDENLMAERFEGMTAQEYEDRAKSYKKQAIQDALSFTGTTVGGVTLGTAGGFLNVGMSSKDSMLEEFGTGFVAGAAIAAGSSNMAFEGSSEKTVRVYNPYDGSLTDVTIKKNGAFLDGQVLPNDFKDGEIIDLTDSRLDKVRTKVQGVLVEKAAENRKERMNADAKKRANKFEDALNYRKGKK